MPSPVLPSIRTKLVRLVILPLCAALVFVTAIHLWREADRYLAAKREMLLATAQIFAATTSTAAATGDADTARQALRGIARVPGLIRAEVDTLSGKRLAGIGAAVRLATDLTIEGAEFSRLDLLNSRTMTVSVPIVDAGVTVGRLTLIADTQDFRAEFENTLLWSLVLSCVLVALGLLFAHRLQRSITAPLLALTSAMVRAETNRTYQPVSVTASDAETEKLAQTFNAMMTEIRSAFAAVLDRESEIIERLSRAGAGGDGERRGRGEARSRSVLDR
jgi:HAMP domain-containing protein